MIAVREKNTWTPLLRNINNLKSALRNQKNHCKADITSNCNCILYLIYIFENDAN